MRIQLTDAQERAGVVAELNAARDTEYTEVLERLPAFVEELNTERARGRVSYVEVEENEADLERFRSWLSKIAARDYFGAPAGETARAAVAAAEAQLADFEAEALRLEAPAEVQPPPLATVGEAEQAARRSARLRAVNKG